MRCAGALCPSCRTGSREFEAAYEGRGLLSMPRTEDVVRCDDRAGTLRRATARVDFTNESAHGGWRVARVGTADVATLWRAIGRVQCGCRGPDSTPLASSDRSSNQFGRGFGGGA